MRKIFDSNHGITLIELIIAIAVLAVMLLGLFSSLTTSIYTSENSKLNAKQQALAQQVMEDVLSDDYAQMVTDWDNRTVLDQGLTADVSIIPDFSLGVSQITIVVRVPQRENRPPFVIATLRGSSE